MVNPPRLRSDDVQYLSCAESLTAGTSSNQTILLHESGGDNVPTSMITHSHVFRDSGEATAARVRQSFAAHDRPKRL